MIFLVISTQATNSDKKNFYKKLNNLKLIIYYLS